MDKVYFFDKHKYTINMILKTDSGYWLNMETVAWALKLDGISLNDIINFQPKNLSDICDPAAIGGKGGAKKITPFIDAAMIHVIDAAAVSACAYVNRNDGRQFRETLKRQIATIEGGEFTEYE